MSEFKHFMIDLETMGQRPTSVITTIAVIAFNETEICDDYFYESIDWFQAIESYPLLTIDESTIEWWEKQSKEAQKDIKGKSNIKHTMTDFTDFVHRVCPEYKEVKIWGNSASFDNVILRHNLTTTDNVIPWPWWNDRCYRTIKNLYDRIPFIHLGEKHCALDDAFSQVAHLQEIIKNTDLELK